MHIAQKLGYIGVFESLKPVTNSEVTMSASMNDEKYRVVAPEAMHETFMSDSEEEGMFRINLKIWCFAPHHLHSHNCKNESRCFIRIIQKHTCMP